MDKGQQVYFKHKAWLKIPLAITILKLELGEKL